MPRGHYGAPQRAFVGAEPPRNFNAPTPTGDTSAWKTAVAFAAGLTGILALGMVTTSFQKPQRSRSRHPSSPYRSIY